VIDKIVDASALAALIFGEPEAALVEQRLRGCDLAAPALLPFEMANVCLKKLRKDPAQRDAILLRFGKMKDFPVDIYTVKPAEMLQLAERFNLSAYDASYLWLARELGAELVTLDARLERAAAALQSSS
jgi:predicted nucleic acid-binding protein